MVCLPWNSLSRTTICPFSGWNFKDLKISTLDSQLQIWGNNFSAMVVWESAVSKFKLKGWLVEWQPNNISSKVQIPMQNILYQNILGSLTGSKSLCCISDYFSCITKLFVQTYININVRYCKREIKYVKHHWTKHLQLEDERENR